MQRLRIGSLLALVIVTTAVAAPQGQRSRGQAPQGPPEIAGKWSGTWSSFNPAKATTQPKEICKQLDADVVRNGETWVTTFEGDCGRPYKYKISMNGRLSGGVVLFTGTVDLGAQDGGVYDWVGRATTDEFIGFYTSAHATGFFNLTRAKLGAQIAATDNTELARMYAEDQADRKDAEKIGWEKISERDAARLARTKAIYKGDGLKTGADYFHAALILQHSHESDDYLLAHELCIVAIGKGEERAKWLAAATEDRFLMNLGRPQRFATQYRPEPPGSDGPIRLYKVHEEVTDGLRREFKAPSLADAKAKEAMFNKK